MAETSKKYALSFKLRNIVEQKDSCREEYFGQTSFKCSTAKTKGKACSINGNIDKESPLLTQSKD